jgi:hypothetical protein
MSRAGREKHPDTLQNRRGGRYRPLQLVDHAEVPVIPPLERGFLPQTRAVWRELWRSRLGSAYQATDLPGLRRWVWYLDQWARATSLRDYRYALRLEKALRELEKAYGLDVLSRMRLGLTILAEHHAVNSLKAHGAPQEIPRRDSE